MTFNRLQYTARPWQDPHFRKGISDAARPRPVSTTTIPINPPADARLLNVYFAGGVVFAVPSEGLEAWKTPEIVRSIESRVNGFTT